MANAFGFVPPDTQPMGGPQQVGAMLLQQGMRAPEPAPSPMLGVTSGDVRQAGARYAGLSPTENSAQNAAIGEALTRMADGAMANPDPLKDRATPFRHLTKLGISEVEARLLTSGGGV